jgi:DNA-directed RNA polymerase subunit L
MENLTISPLKYEIKDPQLMALVKDLLPSEKETVRISFKTEVCIVNGIRRTLIGELPINVLTTSISDIDTNDNYPVDWIQTQLQKLPIKQNYKSIKGSLNIHNKSSDNITVYSKDLKLIGVTHSGKTETVSLDNSYRILVLGANKHINIKNINIVQQYGHSGLASVVNITEYKLEKNKQILSYNTIGVYNAKECLLLAIESIIERLSQVKEFLKSSETSTDTYIISQTTNNEQVLNIQGESHTLGAIITKYAYLVDPSIENISYKLTHDTERNIIITWAHPSKKDIVVNGIVNAIKVLDNIHSKVD